MAKLDKNKWITEPFTFTKVDGDLWIRLDANHLEKLPDGSITKFIMQRLKEKGLI